MLFKKTALSFSLMAFILNLIIYPSNANRPEEEDDTRPPSQHHAPSLHTPTEETLSSDDSDILFKVLVVGTVVVVGAGVVWFYNHFLKSQQDTNPSKPTLSSDQPVLLAASLAQRDPAALNTNSLESAISLPASATKPSSTINEPTTLIALSTADSLGLTAKRNTSLIMREQHTIQEYEEGVTIVTTPKGGIIFIFPTTAYLAFQTHKKGEVPYPSSLLLSTDQSVLDTIPPSVRGLLVSQLRDALDEPTMQTLSTKVEAIFSSASRQPGVKVRSFRSADQSLKEFLISGTTDEILHIISGISNKRTEIDSRPHLAQAFRALSAAREQTDTIDQ